MAEKKYEKIKIYAVIFLAVVLAVSAYFRFLHKKATPDDDQSRTETTGIDMNVPSIDAIKSSRTKPGEPQGYEYYQAVLRDIFSPQIAPGKAGNYLKEGNFAKSPQDLKLEGTIVGGKKSIAIIDGQFFREGDQISGCQLVMIGKKEVLLESDIEKFKLKLMKNE